MRKESCTWIFCRRRHRAIRLRLCLQRRLCVPMWTAQRCGSFYLWWQAENFSGIKSDSSWITSAFTVISPNGCGNRPWQASSPIWARAGRSC
nr:MAG TPA: hypothetical protein [Caudoviricetes sp.]